MRISMTAAGLAAALALGACGGQEPGAGGLTAEEERALDNAAAMLDANNIDVSADSLVANEAELGVEDNAAEGNAAANSQ